MELPSLEQRHRQRRETQQQPQQSVLYPPTGPGPASKAKTNTPRQVLHALAIAQARKQSGEL